MSFIKEINNENDFNNNQNLTGVVDVQNNNNNFLQIYDRKLIEQEKKPKLKFYK